MIFQIIRDVEPKLKLVKPSRKQSGEILTLNSQQNGNMKWEMQDGPYLLPNSAEAVMFNLVEIEHPDKVLRHS